MGNKNCQVKHLVEYAVKENCVISVWDGGQWLITRSQVTDDLLAACEYDKQVLTLFITCNGHQKGKVQIGHDGLMFDYNVSNWLDDWFKEWGKTLTKFDYTCYQCDKPTNWLAPDSRCGDCTRYTVEEIRGEV